MNTLRKRLTQLLGREEGQTLVEYALIILFVAIALVASLGALAGGIQGLIETVSSNPGLGGSGS